MATIGNHASHGIGAVSLVSNTNPAAGTIFSYISGWTVETGDTTTFVKDARGTDAEAFPGASERKITIETMGYTPLILPYFSGREAAQGATNPAIEIADLKFQGGLTDTQRTGLASWRTTRLANTARPGLYFIDIQSGTVTITRVDAGAPGTVIPVTQLYTTDPGGTSGVTGVMILHVSPANMGPVVTNFADFRDIDSFSVFLSSSVQRGSKVIQVSATNCVPEGGLSFAATAAETMSTSWELRILGNSLEVREYAGTKTQG